MNSLKLCVDIYTLQVFSYSVRGEPVPQGLPLVVEP